MKIAFLSFFSGIIERGVETLIPEIAQRLGEKHELVLFQGGSGEGNGYKVVEIPTSWKPSKMEEPLNLRRRLFLDNNSLGVLEFTRKVLPILKKEKFDIIVPWNNGWQAILCKFTGVGNIVVVGQSGLGWDDRVAIWTFPACFIGFTYSQVSWAKKVNPFVKTAIIPNGVDSARFRPDGEKMDFGLPEPIVLCVSALVTMKRQSLAIKAVSKLKKGSLVLVGRGETKKELQILGDKLLPGRFKIMESSFATIDRLFRSADILTFPTSSWESFGLVQLEAMASGLPVVVNDDPIRREIVGNAGLFVNPEDTNAYAVAIEKALKINWRDKPRRQAVKFSWKEIAKKYEQLFLEVSR